MLSGRLTAFIKVLIPSLVIQLYIRYVQCVVSETVASALYADMSIIMHINLYLFHSYSKVRKILRSFLIAVPRVRRLCVLVRLPFTDQSMLLISLPPPCPPLVAFWLPHCECTKKAFTPNLVISYRLPYKKRKRWLSLHSTETSFINVTGCSAIDPWLCRKL